METETGLGTEQATLRYLSAARPVHDELRRTLTQVAGYALMLMTSNGRPTHTEAAILNAEATAAKVADGVRGLQVPFLAAHHHHHLRCASEGLTHACTAALTCTGPGVAERERDDLVRALQSTVENLRAVSRLIPGFETVNFGQACCAVHASAGVGRPLN